jgi:TorA maturation chaperone TorD
MAGLFDVMRHLISTGSGDVAAQQKEFFERYIAGSYEAFCAAASNSEKSNFYKHVARFSRAFLYVEREALKVF